MTDTTREAWDGRPENPERDGWHWLLRDDDEFVRPMFWFAVSKTEPVEVWADRAGMEQRAHDMGARYSYLGPALLPSQVAAAVQAEREAIDAAVAAEYIGPKSMDAQMSPPEWVKGYNAGIADVLSVIRARGPSDALADALRRAEARGMKQAAGMVRALNQERTQTIVAGLETTMTRTRTADEIAAAIDAAAEYSASIEQDRIYEARAALRAQAEAAGVTAEMLSTEAAAMFFDDDTRRVAALLRALAEVLRDAG